MARGLEPNVACDQRYMLAAYAHTAWSRWMQYVFSKSTIKADGTVVIPAALAARWRRQTCTLFEYLSTAEQASDLREADEILRLLAMVEEANAD